MDKAIFWCYLAWASWQDIQEKQVIRYTHILGFIAIAVSGLMNHRWLWENRKEVLGAILICLILQVISALLKLYGLADVIVGFEVLLFLSISYKLLIPMELYLWLHAVSGGLLFAVQICRNNVKGLRLKQSVPYIPYISIAFILTNMVL